MKTLKVKDHPHLLKDTESKAVLNNNYAALLEYKKKKMMEDELHNLKSEMADMKDMMKTILSLLNK